MTDAEEHLLTPEGEGEIMLTSQGNWNRLVKASAQCLNSNLTLHISIQDLESILWADKIMREGADEKKSLMQGITGAQE